MEFRIDQRQKHVSISVLPVMLHSAQVTKELREEEKAAKELRDRVKVMLEISSFDDPSVLFTNRTPPG